MKRRTLMGLAVVLATLVVGATAFTAARAQAPAPGDPGPGGPSMHGGPGFGPGMHDGPGMWGGPGMGHGFGMRGHGMGGHRMSPGMMKRMVSVRLDEALTQASVTPEQRVKIHAARDRVFAAFDGQRPDHRAQADQALKLFEGDRLDAGQLEALHAPMEQHHQAIRKAITQAVVEIHDTLTPAQRKIVADYVKTHAPGAMR
jgi:periplasmic protein CpxP/Spy